MSRHRTLRLAVLTAVAAGALLVPAGAAVAADPTAVPSTTTDNPTPADREAIAEKEAAAKKAEAAKKAGSESLSPEEAKTRKLEEARKAKDTQRLPRGGVAAGESTAENSGSTMTIAGSATGALLLAGAGTFVLRRRSAHRREG
ncbi:hypothetical protein [Streptomyces cavernae]|uniref:hypothetical protein n=1 Tax=Streptomyces cavernae TaxID=2259034 RepID=UPI000FEBD846|nr:hypothetical protein [Streptomyces cavernae]